MKGKRHKTEEIIRILRMADGGKAVEEVCREANICDRTFYAFTWAITNQIDVCNKGLESLPFFHVRSVLRLVTIRIPI